MSRIRTALGTSLIFAAVGPAVGTLIYSGWGHALQSEPQSLKIAVLGTVWMLPFGYIIGLLPAAVAGGLSGAVLAYFRRAPSFVAASAVIGGLTIAALSFGSTEGGQNWSGLINLALIGAASGAVCSFATWSYFHRGRPEAPSAGDRGNAVTG